MELLVFQVVLDPVTLEVSVVGNGPTSRCNSTDRFHSKQIMLFLKRACAFLRSKMAD